MFQSYDAFYVYFVFENGKNISRIFILLSFLDVVHVSCWRITEWRRWQGVEGENWAHSSDFLKGAAPNKAWGDCEGLEWIAGLRAAKNKRAK